MWGGSRFESQQVYPSQGLLRIFFLFIYFFHFSMRGRAEVSNVILKLITWSLFERRCTLQVMFIMNFFCSFSFSSY